VKHAEGYALELAGAEKERDLWRVEVDSQYVTQTQDLGNIKEYQLYHKSGKVPIMKMTRI
jgi:hypothetical protein